MLDVERIAQTLAGDRRPQRYNSGWLTWCPAHTDENPSFFITSTNNDKLLWKCLAGCSQSAVIEALKSQSLRQSAEKLKVETGKKSVGNQCNTAAVPGLTLEELAKAKGLQIDGPKGLRAWGVACVKRQGATVISIPYMNEAGEVAAVRYRLSLDGAQRFSWRKGDKMLLYGLWRLPEIRKAGWVLLVEGESDCWTAWLHDIPALGLPGKSTWRAEWAQHLSQVQVFLWQGPDAAELPFKLGRDLPDLLVLPAPEGVKDLNQAHLGGQDVPSLLKRLKAQAIPAATLVKKHQDARIRELKELARPVLEHPDPLALVEQAIRLSGYGGDLTPALITYLAITSRVLNMRSGSMPVHLLLISQASGGKTFTLRVVLNHLPGEAVHIIAAGSPRVLIYDDVDLRHRAVIFGEADSLPAGEDNPAASAIRNLLQDHQLHYRVTERNPETGQFTVREVRKDGPTVLITTSTRSLGDQLDTRMFTLPIDDSKAKIAAALMAQADAELSGTPPPDEALISFQAYLQAQAPWDVVVPFVKPLASIIAKRVNAPRILRDFARLLSLVKTVTVLRHAHRKKDDRGRLIAEINDYATVFELTKHMFEATISKATKEIRETVAAVKEMLTSREPVTATTLAAKLGIDRGTASRRVQAAIRQGWLRNRQTKKGQPWDLAPGEPLPEETDLPSPAEVSSAASVAGVAPAHGKMQHQHHPEIIDNFNNHCTVAVHTERDRKQEVELPF